MSSPFLPAAARQAGFDLLDRKGRRFDWYSLFRAWCRDDSIQARLVDAKGTDWAFDAILHPSPLSAPSVLRSAIDRNLRELSQANDPVRASLPHPRSIASKTPTRLARRVVKQRNWTMELLDSDPLEGGRAVTRPFLPEPGTLRADPCAIALDGREWVLFEEMRPGDRGRLRAAVRKQEGWDVLEGEIHPRECHLSWPLVFEHEGRVFMTPETGEAGEVGLWEAEAFPSGWVRRATLLEGRPWHDATLLHRDGIWWLFVSCGGDHPQDHSAQLDIFWSPDLLGEPFRPHAGNPISTSVVGARPAGAFFERDGRLYRPAQDCRGGYGSAVLIHEVLTLSPERFEERLVARLDPPRGAAGIHTLNRLPGGGWIVDVFR